MGGATLPIALSLTRAIPVTVAVQLWSLRNNKRGEHAAAALVGWTTLPITAVKDLLAYIVRSNAHFDRHALPPQQLRFLSRTRAHQPMDIVHDPNVLLPTIMRHCGVFDGQIKHAPTTQSVHSILPHPPFRPCKVRKEGRLDFASLSPVGTVPARVACNSL